MRIRGARGDGAERLPGLVNGGWPGALLADGGGVPGAMGLLWSCANLGTSGTICSPEIKAGMSAAIGF